MDILEIIKTKRSIAKVTEQVMSNDLIEQIIEAGCYAPTHNRTEPWRFNVFINEGRKSLQNAIEEHINNSQISESEKNQKILKIKNKSYRAPVIIAVWCAVGRSKKNPPEWEDNAAVAACLQNMSLATHALGCASIWRTGNIVDMPEVHKLCKTKEDVFDTAKGDKIIGFLYVGKQDSNKAHPTRNIAGWKNKISWVTNY